MAVPPYLLLGLGTVSVGISCLDSLGAELMAFEILRPPSWIIHFQFGCTVSALNSPGQTKRV